MNKLKTRVLVVDRRPLIKTEFLAAIESSHTFQCVGFFKDAKSAMLSLPRSRPEIIVATVDSGVEIAVNLIGKMKFQYPGIRIVIQSDLRDDDMIFNLLTIGLAGFTNIPDDAHDMILMLNKVEEGSYPMSALLNRKIFENFRLNKFSELSMRQSEILKLMILGGTYNSIASSLQISKETAKTHMKNLYRKLNVHSKQEALAKAVEEKLIMVI